MKIYSAVSGPLKVNTYFIVNEQTKEAFVIDAGANYHLVEEAQKKFNIKVVAVLLTHAHFDHSRCCLKLQEMGIKIYLSKLDTPKLYDGGHLGGKNFPEFTPDYTFIDNEVISICGINVKVLITPGHTDGSACFIIENNIFSGDTLLFESVGRTDMLGGNPQAIESSIFRLYNLIGDYNVYSGHGQPTTLSHERVNNPFFRQV